MAFKSDDGKQRFGNRMKANRYRSPNKNLMLSFQSSRRLP